MVLTPAAERQLDRLSGVRLAALRGVILALRHEPVPDHAAKLTGTSDLWRIRLRIQGEPWRVVYQLRKRERLIVVTRVVRRNEGTYRGTR